MKKVWNWLFGKRKDGKCRFWQHDWGEDERVEYMSGTNQYIDGKQIKRKRYYHITRCKKCGERIESDSYPALF